MCVLFNCEILDHAGNKNIAQITCGLKSSQVHMCVRVSDQAKLW